MKSFLVALACLFFTTNIYGTFLPNNHLWLEDNPNLVGTMTETEFNSVLDDIQYIYEPILADLGFYLEIDGLWSNPQVNAQTYRKGNTVKVEIFGGLARRKEITLDGLALVVCHEIGHNVGGFPYYPSSPMSNEGQSDYWATLACTKKLWASEDNSGVPVLPQAKSICDKYEQTTEARQLCYRSIMAGHSTASLLAYLGGSSIGFIPDSKVVARTANSHPEAQCRFDTYIAGTICPVAWDDAFIPPSELASNYYSCSEKEWNYGTKPRCWYAPRK